MNQRITKVRKKLQNGFSEAIPIGAKAENVTLQNGTVLQDVIEELQTGRAGHADLTQAEYDALPQSQKNNGTIYFVADGAAGTNNAAAVRYNNNASGLSGTNVQAAIDEINTNVETQVTALKAVDATLKDAATKTVANNLVTTGAGYVLDARQGKVLNDKITSLNNSFITPLQTFYSSTYPSLSVTVARSNHLVSLYVYCNSNYSLPKGAYTYIVTLPKKYWPQYIVPFTLYDFVATSATNAMIIGSISSAGVVSIWVYPNAPDTNNPRGSVTYYVQ